MTLFSPVDRCATRRPASYKIVCFRHLGNIARKTNGTCEVLCQNFFIGRAAGEPESDNEPRRTIRVQPTFFTSAHAQCVRRGDEFAAGERKA